MQLSDYHFDLPDEQIARFPATERSNSRLLRLNRQSGAVQHHVFADLIDLLTPGDLLVMNNTRVIPARLFGHKESGGKVEILIERVLSHDCAQAHLSASKAFRPGMQIRVGTYKITVNPQELGLYTLHLGGAGDWYQVLEQHGHIPLPPYLKRADELLDRTRYQTVYAKVPGAVAAPTAGLHFDAPLLKKLQAKSVECADVTLHVGAGTFQPIHTNDIAAHTIHAEWMCLDASTCDQINRAKAEKRRIVAVGTTTVRCLESIANQDGCVAPYQGDTRLLIVPGYSFKCVDALITNFHLPQSTLLMLVAAFAGRENVLSAYQAALQAGYRFYSYGDAMFIV